MDIFWPIEGKTVGEYIDQGYNEPNTHVALIEKVEKICNNSNELTDEEKFEIKNMFKIYKSIPQGMYFYKWKLIVPRT